MSVADEITRLQNAKTKLKTDLINAYLPGDTNDYSEYDYLVFYVYNSGTSNVIVRVKGNTNTNCAPNVWTEFKINASLFNGTIKGYDEYGRDYIDGVPYKIYLNNLIGFTIQLEAISKEIYISSIRCVKNDGTSRIVTTFDSNEYLRTVGIYHESQHSLSIDTSIKHGDDKGSLKVKPKITTAGNSIVLRSTYNTDKLDVLSNSAALNFTRAYLNTCVSASNLFNTSYRFNKFINMHDLQYDDTKNVRYFFQTFVGCSEVVEINTSSGQEFLSMYWGCTCETFPYIDISQANGITSMYSNCKRAKNLPVINLIHKPNAWSTFTECHELPKVEFINWNMDAATHGSMFANDYSLKAIVIRSFGANKGFNPSNLYGCYRFDPKVYDSNYKETLNAKYNPTGVRDGLIYVPKDYVEELKTATGWSTYGDRIVALDDYIIPNEDGTINLIEGVFDATRKVTT